MTNSAIGQQIKDKLQDNQDFRDGFMNAVIMMRMEDEIIEIGKERMEEIFRKIEEVEA